MSVVNLTEEQVLELLDWPLVCDAVEQSMRSICEIRVKDDQPTAKQPTRIFTPTEKGIFVSHNSASIINTQFIAQSRFKSGTLLCMPGFIGNYKLGNQEKVLNSLGCKLVTFFQGNSSLNPPKPNILGNIFLFSEQTGELKAIIQASEITAWRTAAASLVATKYSFSQRPSSPKIDTVAILGCGVQVIQLFCLFFPLTFTIN